MEGVDYTHHPSPAGLADAGIKFVVRYAGVGGAWKHLTKAEVGRLRAAGLLIVANVEGGERGLLNGSEAGEKWARAAHEAFTALGMPRDRPIYLSVDFDVTEKEWHRVADALRGAAKVIGPHRVGVYGSYNCVSWAYRDNVAQWFWQTYAWSHRQWFGENHLEQYRNGVRLAGGEVDRCRAKKEDFGQWGLGGTVLHTLIPAGEDDMSVEEIANAVVEKLLKSDTLPGDPKKNYTVGGALYDSAIRAHELQQRLDAVHADVKIVLGRKSVDEKAIADAVHSQLTGFKPEMIADLIAASFPAAFADQVVTALAARLARA